MAYVVLKTKERKRRPMMQRLFMGLIVTMGLFFGYDYMFEQSVEVTLEPKHITSESIDYELNINHIPDDVTSFLVIIEGADFIHQVESHNPLIEEKITDLDSNTSYTFTVYTISNTNQTKVFETEVHTKEMENNE